MLATFHFTIKCTIYVFRRKNMDCKTYKIYVRFTTFIFSPACKMRTIATSCGYLAPSKQLYTVPRRHIPGDLNIRYRIFYLPVSFKKKIYNLSCSLISKINSVCEQLAELTGCKRITIPDNCMTRNLKIWISHQILRCTSRGGLNEL